MENLSDFLQQIKTKCESRAKEIAAIELSCFDKPGFKEDLKENFGFTDKKLEQRRKKLIKSC